MKFEYLVVIKINTFRQSEYFALLGKINEILELLTRLVQN